MLMLLLACSAPYPDIIEGSAESSGDPEHSSGSDSGTDSNTDSGTDTTPDEADPWVGFTAPQDGATVSNPVTFQISGEGISTLSLSADGWPMASWEPAQDGWSVSYTFSGTGYERVVLLEGLDEDGDVLASAELRLTVEADEDGVSLAVPYFYQYSTTRHDSRGIIEEAGQHPPR